MRAHASRISNAVAVPPCAPNAVTVLPCTPMLWLCPLAPPLKHSKHPCTNRNACRLFEQDGVTVVCDTMSLEFLRGAVIEFEDSLMRSAFQVRSSSDTTAALVKQGAGARTTLGRG